MKIVKKVVMVGIVGIILCLVPINVYAYITGQSSYFTAGTYDAYGELGIQGISAYAIGKSYGYDADIDITGMGYDVYGLSIPINGTKSQTTYYSVSVNTGAAMDPMKSASACVTIDSPDGRGYDTYKAEAPVMR